MNKLEREILNTFKDVDLKPVKLLKCDSAGELIDNGYGVEFNKPEYAVICEEHWFTFLSDEQFEKLVKLEYKHDIAILKLYAEAVKEDRLKSDGYTIIWNNENVNIK